jgi:hypothetical protein
VREQERQRETARGRHRDPGAAIREGFRKLVALGVPDDEIVADYALSEQHMLRHMHIHRASDDAPAGSGLLPTWLAATSATMEATLHAISEEWGSVGGYLESIGIPAEELRQISDALVECVSEHQDEP